MPESLMATTLTAENKEYVPSSWETVPCPFCGTEKNDLLEKFGFEHRYRYVRCEGCALAYQNPRPAYTEEFTETAYEVYTTQNHFKAADGLSEHGKIVYDEFVYNLKEIESFATGKKNFLEIGCSTGFFCKVAADRGWKPIGIEISRQMAKAAHDSYGFESRAGDWMKMDFDFQFDAIYCSHVIEHVPHPREWMAKMAKVLAPGGIICISIPNMNSYDRKYKRVLKRLGLRKDKWEKWRTPDHLYEPCEKSFTAFAESCGFDIVKMYSYPSQWVGKVSPWHRLYHFILRAGAKSRYYLRPRTK